MKHTDKYNNGMYTVCSIFYFYFGLYRLQRWLVLQIIDIKLEYTQNNRMIHMCKTTGEIHNNYLSKNYNKKYNYNLIVI